MCPDTGCEKTFLRSSHLKHHIKSAHAGTRDYPCKYDGCGKSFTTGTRLRRHHATHEGRQKFECTFGGCGQIFRKHNTLQKHVLQVHEGRKPFVCEVEDVQGKPCGAGFDAASNLKTHVASAHSGRKYNCAICSDTTQQKSIERAIEHESPSFASLPALQSHIRREHPPTCQECGCKFVRLFELRLHIDSQHGGLTVDERKHYSCLEPGCGRSFTAKNNLAAHIKNFHRQPKAFVCGGVDPNTLNRASSWDGSGACGRSFSTKGNLVEHIRTFHIGLEPGKAKPAQNESITRISPSTQGKTSNLLQLTGSGYENGRVIECPFQNCAYRFCKKFDLQRHLQIYHSFQEPKALIFGADASTPAIQHSFDGSCYVESAADIEADRVLSLQFGEDDRSEDYFDKLEIAAAQGGDFWLGGGMQCSLPMTGRSNSNCGNGYSSSEQQDATAREMPMIDPGLQ